MGRDVHPRCRVVPHRGALARWCPSIVGWYGFFDHATAGRWIQHDLLSSRLSN